MNKLQDLQFFINELSNIDRAKKGRDPMFKCTVCGKFIAYKDIPNKVRIDFTPDSEYTIEETIFTHLHCL